MAPVVSANTTSLTTDDTTAGFVIPTYALPAIIYVSVGVQIALIAVIFFGNSWVIILMARFRRLRNCSNYFTANMAVADFLLSLALIPGVIITFDPSFVSNANACALLWCSQIFASTMSVISLLCISVDRLIKIVKPLRYHSFVTEHRAVNVILALWIYGICSIIVPPFVGLRNDHVWCFDFTRFFNYYHIHYMFIFNGLFPYMTLLVIYGIIFIVVKEKQRTSRQFEPATARHLSPWRKELKALSMLAVIVGFTGVAWLPSITLVILDLHYPTIQASLTLRTVLSWFTYFNSGVNPILYALRSDSFKSASRELFSKDIGSLVSSRSNRVHPSSKGSAT